MYLGRTQSSCSSAFTKELHIQAHYSHIFENEFDSFIHFHPKIYSLTILLDTCEWEILQLTKHK